MISGYRDVLVNGEESCWGIVEEAIVEFEMIDGLKLHFSGFSQSKDHFVIKYAWDLIID